MEKKDEFKGFAKKHPELIQAVSDGSMTWQKFYEIYDIYGEDEEVWKTYFNKENVTSVSNIASKLKNIDTNALQEHIKNAQKALGVLSELTGSSKDGEANAVPKVPRPIHHFFED